MGITRTSRERQRKLTTGRIKRISLWGRSSRDRDSSSLLDRRIPTKGRIISSFCKKQRKDPCGVNNAYSRIWLWEERALVWNLDSFGFGSGKKGLWSGIWILSDLALGRKGSGLESGFFRIWLWEERALVWNLDSFGFGSGKKGLWSGIWILSDLALGRKAGMSTGIRA
ncbi:hypothetical protein SAY87_004957 [Trapa incisa]|uniref:Uncharacterized protein n=1 Tax=Trapa incisa TaxID=236973 RepID=A0AAN7PTR4_9MYRT|nr:hypothetical protein SAY87_004957 [Trapa incisa]